MCLQGSMVQNEDKTMPYTRRPIYRRPLKGGANIISDGTIYTQAHLDIDSVGASTWEFYNGFIFDVRLK